ncbi:hypothetical protein ACWEPC_24030 [Nonomuraea sp. NPDC004297]
MKARQMGGACAVAAALLAAGAITASGAALADDHHQPTNRITVCSTGPVDRSAHVRVDVKCDIKVKVDVDRHRHMREAGEYFGDTLEAERLDALAYQ